jgi:DivIVA domain-containing protein
LQFGRTVLHFRHRLPSGPPAELADGRLAGRLIENAAQSRARFSWTSGYDVDAVDWFLDQLARSLASADPGVRW